MADSPARFPNPARVPELGRPWTGSRPPCRRAHPWRPCCLWCGVVGVIESLSRCRSAAVGRTWWTGTRCGSSGARTIEGSPYLGRRGLWYLVFDLYPSRGLVLRLSLPGLVPVPVLDLDPGLDVLDVVLVPDLRLSHPALYPCAPISTGAVVSRAGGRRRRRRRRHRDL